MNNPPHGQRHPWGDYESRNAKDETMALSDVLYEAGLELEEGAELYGQPDCPIHYGERIEWVKRAAELLKRAAGEVQEGGTLPALPQIESDFFVGPQRDGLQMS